MEEKEAATRQDVYQMVTDKIIAHLEKGVVPWKQSWVQEGVPFNLLTKKEYRGINTWMLSGLGYERNAYLTFKQLKGLGGSVIKGEKSHLVVFWNWQEVEDKETMQKKKIPFLRYYMVFNIAQCKEIPLRMMPEPMPVFPNTAFERAESIVAKMPKLPKIKHKDSYPFYHPLYDYVNIPKMEHFHTSEEYYSTLFHELIHSTGHEGRVGRKEIMNSNEYGSEAYSVEELTAEFGASFLNSFAGITTVEESNASYIQGWLEKLKQDKKFVLYASSQAQKATDYILGEKTIDEEPEETAPKTSE